MRVLALQLTANAKPLLNTTFINAAIPKHEGIFEMKLVKDGIEVVHKTKGTYILPMSSVSWFRFDPKEAMAEVPVKRGRGRPRKVVSPAA